MSKANAEILELIKALAADVALIKAKVEELQEDNASSAVNGEAMYKALNAKFDIFKNLEAQSREMREQSATTKRKLTRPAFFKELFMKEREKYMNVLYTQEEIDAAYQDATVVAKKKDSEKITKVATFIYNNHIKINNPEGRLSAFAGLYDQLA